VTDAIVAAGSAVEPRRIIVTGAGGFVGRHLVDRLVGAAALVTGIGRGAQPADWPSGARWLRADLAEPALYAFALAEADCVVHLAAVTGKASRADFFRGNVDVTNTLLAACRAAGVRRFVFVSSIAAGFANRRHYHYADSKIAAEALVRASPLTSLIVRPTMILGPGSPIEQSLARLARLPVSPIFGNGRRLVEPVDVEDVADALAGLAQAPEIKPGTIELGGPERYDLRTLYARLRSARGASAAPRFLYLPLGFARWGLALVERPLLRLLPLTAGQLATFANDSVAAAGEVPLGRLQPRRTSPRPSMPDPTSARRPTLKPTSLPAQTNDERRMLAAEGNQILRYLIGAAPDDYQVDKYVDLHQHRPLLPQNAFDNVLLRAARSGQMGLALADTYSGLMLRTSVVRSKLVAALAIAESSGASSVVIARPHAGGKLTLVVMAVRGSLSLLTLFIAALALGPLHLMLGARPGRAARD
jgi:nucleoside-diphosphate-sugar epimerase